MDAHRNSQSVDVHQSPRIDSFSIGLDGAEFPFWKDLGGLKEHWYAVALSSGVALHKPIRQVALGVPLVLWRTAGESISAFVDVCPHRQAQLSKGAADADGLSCPYHGWRFDIEGVCKHIPAATAGCGAREAARLKRVPVCERAGVVWVWMGQQTPTLLPAPEQETQAGWSRTRSIRTLSFDVDDLIENFMDVAHTPVVHAGLIRGIGKPRDRGVTIETGQNTVQAVHDPVEERVGPLSRLVVPRGKVCHRDTFVLPSDVRVEYGFGGQPASFVAQLHMTPVVTNQTLLVVSLSVRLGWLNPFIKLFLPRLMRKVLLQDIHILEQQRQNLDLLGKRKRRSLQADALDAIVRAMRSHRQDPSVTAPRPGVRRVEVRI